mgnify:CR=1 FL=1
MVIPASMTPGTLARLHDAHQGLTSMLHPARRTVYWPMLQDDISEMVQKCNECQRYCNKKPIPTERQISATCPLELMGGKVVQFQCQQALVTVDYYSVFLLMTPFPARQLKLSLKHYTTSSGSLG